MTGISSNLSRLSANSPQNLRTAFLANAYFSHVTFVVRNPGWYVVFTAYTRRGLSRFCGIYRQSV